MEVRLVRGDDDWRQISRVYEESWKYAYRGMIPDDYLDSIPEGRWVSLAGRPGFRHLVLLDEDHIVGTSTFCASRLEELAGWGEIVSIYLLPAYMGRGYGRALIEAAVQGLTAMGFQNIFLWVLEENVRARRFYEKMGFANSGAFLHDNLGGKDIREVRYVYSVPSDASGESGTAAENRSENHVPG